MLKIMYCGIFHRNLMRFFFSFSYDECVGPGATQIYIPTDDPPPYSLTDPCQRNEISINISLEEAAASGTTGQGANYAVTLQDLQQPISSISLSSLTLEAAPLYETVVCEQNIPIPLVPMEVLKNSSTDYQTLLNQIMWIKAALSFNSSEELRLTKTFGRIKPLNVLHILYL